MRCSVAPEITTNLLTLKLHQAANKCRLTHLSALLSRSLQCARQWTLPDGRERGRECRATIIACITFSLDGHLPDNLTCNPTTLHNGTLFVFMPITAIKWKGQTLVKRVTWIFAFVTVDILWGHIENFAPRHAEMRLPTPDFTLAPYGDPWFLQTLQSWRPFSTFEFSNIWWQFAYFRVTGFQLREHTCVDASLSAVCVVQLCPNRWRNRNF